MVADAGSIRMDSRVCMTPLATFVPQLANRRILVIGDILLDEYLFGCPTRLSREAPIPVLELIKREIVLGGAANPSRNIVALGSQAIQVGVIGADAEGEQLRTALAQHHIKPTGLITSANRPTTLKTRIVAYEEPRLPQQLARIDRLSRHTLDSYDEQRILANLANLIPQVDAVLCSDYQLGLLSPTIIDTVRTLCYQHNVLLTVDAQGNAHYYRGVDLFRCNNIEAAAALARPLHSEDDFRKGLEALRANLQARLVIVTRGPQGLSLHGIDVEYTYLPAVDVREVYDTTGAGDTFIAVATLALAACLEPLIAAQLANAASALVVRKLGNAVVTLEELRQIVHETEPRLSNTSTD